MSLGEAHVTLDGRGGITEILSCGVWALPYVVRVVELVGPSDIQGQPPFEFCQDLADGAGQVSSLSRSCAAN